MAQVEKLSVSMPPEALSWVREKASDSGGAVSAVLTALVLEARAAELRQVERLRGLDAILAQHLETPFTADELREGEETLQGLGLP